MRRGLAIGLAVAAALALSGPALAQSSLGIGVAEQGVVQDGPLSGFFAWIAQHQQDFYARLRAALIDIRDSGAAVWLLVGLSFVYGVLHAAGPGHGKVVISSYMLANETALRRGILLSFCASIVQALSAIAIVGLGFLVLRQLSITQTQTTRFVEIASYGFVIALGVWLLARKTGALRPSARPATLSAAAVRPGRDGHGHGHGHGHDHAPGETCASCGHAHMPAPDRLAGPMGWRDAAAVTVSVGLRPCTGALIVLTFAFLSGLWVAGIVSVFAMAIGVAITVSFLATLAVTAKNVALRLSGTRALSGRLGRAIEIGGALLIVAMGVTLLGGALGA